MGLAARTAAGVTPGKTQVHRLSCLPAPLLVAYDNKMDAVPGMEPCARTCPANSACTNCGIMQQSKGSVFCPRAVHSKVPSSVLQQELYRNQELCDVAINVTDRDMSPATPHPSTSSHSTVILAHRVVLAAHSPQLRAIFASSPASPTAVTPTRELIKRSLSAESSSPSRHRSITLSTPSTPRLFGKTSSAGSDGADSGNGFSLGGESAAGMQCDEGLSLSRPIMSIDVNDVGVNSVRTVLDFAYTGVLAITVERVENLLKAAISLGFKEVEQLVRQYLVKQPAAVVLRMLIAAHLKRLRNRLQSSAVYIEMLFSLCEEQFETITECPELMSMPFELFHALLGSNRLVLYSEECVFQTVLKWVQHHRAAQRQGPDYFSSLVSLVRLPFVSPEFLTYRILPLCDRIADPAFREQVQSALVHHRQAAPDPRLQLNCAMFHQYSPRVYQPKPAARLLAVTTGSSTPSDVPGIECLDLSKEGHSQRLNWRTVGRRLVGQSNPAVISSDNNVIYVIGGASRGKSLDTAMSTDIIHDNGKWTSLPAMLAQRDSPIATIFNKDIYVIGGCTSGQTLDLVERFSFRLRRWCLAAPMSTPRAAAGVATNDSLVFVVGGCVGGSALSSVECYDVQENEWYMLPEMQCARISPSVVFVDTRLMVFGGHNTSGVQATAEYYDAVARTWRSLPPLKTPRTCASALLQGNKVLLGGGHDGFHRLCNIDEFNLDSNEWRASSLPLLTSTDTHVSLLLIEAGAALETFC
ncbi:kelch-like protein 18 isoform X2 [Sycon ciliatum]|uniref:kelch-like protein 18 isoform X2 n=1 Tax=Sycon ciliatum TaxID=27933 RepID=UPI0020AD9812|eukprot:scpid15098/ scgid15880/ Kelch-like protein 2; Actin-binding protein Mayven